MGQLRTVTRAFALAGGGAETPGEVLSQLNRYQLSLGDEEMFTVVYAIADPDGGRVMFASAGHPPPLVRSPDGEVSYLEGGGGLMGIQQTSYETHEAPLSAGSTLVLYTDGLVERRGETLDAGLERLATAVRSGPRDPSDLCEQILSSLLPPDGRLSDDVTALIAQISA
jgi:serine phosphatase RsbU (regulator of sigma subunit)